MLRTLKVSFVFSLLFLLCVAGLAASPAAAQGMRAGKAYEPAWESLKEHQVPEWLLDAKFGIYAHWGVYSVPAYGNEWYAKLMYDPANQRNVYEHHRQTYGPRDKFGYKDFIPMFKAEKFDPDEWAEVIRQSGARYAGIAVVHHDGFALWHSQVNRWNAGNMGPRRDLYGDLVKALRGKGLKIVATEHHMRTFNWYLPAGEAAVEQARKEGLDLFDPRYADFYWNDSTSTKQQFVAQWKAKLLEVIDKYRPDVLWFDGGDFLGTDVADSVMSLLAHYYNQSREWKSEVEVLNKFAANRKFNFPREFGMLTFEGGRDRPPSVDRSWIDDLNIGTNSWGYVQDLKLRRPDELIFGLVDRVSRGGGLLLSLSPKANGELPNEQKELLREMGDWLRVNGEAIYGTRPWKVHSEGSIEKLMGERGGHTVWNFDKCSAGDIRFTRKGGRLYAIALGWPDGGTLTIKTLGAGAKLSTEGILSISLLGAKHALKWSQGNAGLTITLPREKPCKYAYALRIALRGKMILK